MRLGICRAVYRHGLSVLCLWSLLAGVAAAQVTIRTTHPRLLYLPPGSTEHRTFDTLRAPYMAHDRRYVSYVALVLASDPSGQPYGSAAKYVLTNSDGNAAEAVLTLTSYGLSYSGSDGSTANGADWALAYDWVYDHLTASQRISVEAKLRSWANSCLSDLNGGGPSEWHGRAQLACQGWIVSLALPDDNSGDTTLRNSFWNQWQDALRAIDLAEGWPEGPGYWANNRAMYFPMAYEAWQTAVLSNPPFAVADPLRPIRMLGLWQMYTDRGDGSMERYGDVSSAVSYAGNGTLPSSFDYYATVTRDPLLATYCEYARTVRTSTYDYYEPTYWWRWGFTYDPSVTKPDGFTFSNPAATLNAFAPKSQMFGQNAFGLVAIRTGWGPGHTAITYKAGDYLAHHGHFDQGTFTIYKNAPLVINSGGYGNYTGANRLNYFVRTVAKNSILVERPGEVFPQDGAGTCANDGGGQRIVNATGSTISSVDNWLANKTTGKHYELANINKYEYVDGAYTYVDSDLTNAYNTPTYDRGNTGGKVTKVTRQVLWLADKQVLVIFDRVTSTNAAYKKKWLLHTPNKPAGGTDSLRLGAAANGLMVVDGSTIPDNILTSTNGTGKLFHQVLLPASYEVNKVGGPDYRWYVETDGSDDNGYNGANQLGYTPDWWSDYGDWRIEVTPKVRQLSDTFLNILWPRDTSTSSVPISLVLRNDAVATVLQADDVVVGFGTFGAIASDLAYSLDAAGPTTHRLVDLAAGATYWVLCGYSSLQQVQATPQGVLQFADPAAGSHDVTISRTQLYLPADTNRDGIVDVVDLLTIVGSFGLVPGDPGYDPAADFNRDGSVDVVDLLILVESFGL